MTLSITHLAPLVAAGVVAAGIAVAPSAAADSEFCTNLTTGSTKCEKQGDVEINDGLSHANTTVGLLAGQGLGTGGPYFGTLGGGNR